MPADARVGFGLVWRGGRGRLLARAWRGAASRLIIRGGRPSRARLPEVLADEVALLGQELVEVLVDVRLADRLGGQVQVLDLLELARMGGRRVLPSGACR